MPAIRVAVAAPFPEILRIQESTSEYSDEIEVCAMISSASAVVDQMRLLQPDVLLLSDALDVAAGDTMTRLGAVAPSSRLVVLAQPGSAQRRPAIADAVVDAGATALELRDAIVAAAGTGRAELAPPAHSPLRRGAHPARLSMPPPWLRVSPGPQPELIAAAGATEPATPSGSRTIVVFSGKGGSGTSIVATNLATALAVGGARVALADLDLQFGDVGVLLRLETHPASIESAVGQDGAVDPAALERALASTAQGVHVLLAPSAPEGSDLVSAAALVSIVAELSHGHDVVVLDTPAQLDERVVAVMELADHILLVTDFATASVKDTKLTLRLLQALGVDPDRVAVLLNQTRPRVRFDREEVERALRFPVLASLPFASRMDESVDSGRPLVVVEPRSAFTRQLHLVVDHVACSRGVPSVSAR